MRGWGFFGERRFVNQGLGLRKGGRGEGGWEKVYLVRVNGFVGWVDFGEGFGVEFVDSMGGQLRIMFG